MSRSNTEDFIDGAKKVLYKKIMLKLNKETAKKPIARQCLACLLDRAQAGRTSREQGLGRIRRSFSVSSCSFFSPVPLEKHLVERSALASVVYSPRAEAVEHLPRTCTTHVHVTVATIPGHLVDEWFPLFNSTLGKPVHSALWCDLSVLSTHDLYSW